MIEKIVNEAKKQIVDFFKEYSVTPFEINNGYCEDFAMEILSGLNLKESKDLFVIQFVNLTNTADDNIIVEGRDIDLGTCVSVNLNFRKDEKDISFSKIKNLCNEYIKHEPQIIYSLNKI